MAYATYEFYARTYGGDMPEIDFVRWSGRATEYIDVMTHGRAASAPDSMTRPLAMAFCEIIESFHREDQMMQETANGTIKSANNDGLSVTYGTDGVPQANRRIQSIHTWLTRPVNLTCGWI